MYILSYMFVILFYSLDLIYFDLLNIIIYFFFHLIWNNYMLIPNLYITLIIII